MTAIECPYCGAIMNSPLKFCLACGHAVSETDMKKFGGIKTAMKGGVTKRLDEHLSHSSFERAKKSFVIVRGVREILYLVAVFCISLLLFFFAIKFTAQSVRHSQKAEPQKSLLQKSQFKIPHHQQSERLPSR